MALTAEQWAIIENNRKKALERRAAKASLSSNSNQQSHQNSNHSYRVNQNSASNQQTQIVARPVNTPSANVHSNNRLSNNTTNNTTSSISSNYSQNATSRSNIQFSSIPRPSINQQSTSVNRTNFASNNFSSNYNSNNTSQANFNRSNNNFITPAKRPGENINRFDGKRPNLQNKSPYEQVIAQSIPTFEIDFKLISNREFVLDFKYHSKLIEEIKKFPNPRYDPKNREWIFKLENYKEICGLLNKLKIDKLKLSIKPGFPENVLEVLKDTLKYDDMKIDLETKINSSIIERLFPYQVEGIKFGVRREGRCLLGDSCGLGKTMQAIGLSIYYFDDWPLLIICPSSIKFQWREALLKWVPGLKANDIKEIDSKKNYDESSSYLVVITSYDSIHKADAYIREPKIAILDECHMVKDSKTRRFNLISKLINKSKRLILISGTPAMSRPIELFTQLKLLMPKVFSNKNKFIDRYCDPKMTKWGKQANGCANLDELKVILQSTVMIRRMKEDVLSELPSKRRVKINLDCHLASKDKSELEKFVARFKGPQTIDTENESFGTAYMKTAETKLEPIKNYLEVILERGTKFLFFAHHRLMIDEICNFLCHKKITFIKIDGSTSSSDRSKCCEMFQNDDSCKGAVLSITAAGVGLNLTAAQLVIFGELYFNPGALIQAEDRVHRIGQKDSVYIEYLIAPGTLDDHIWNMVFRKVDTLDSLGIKSGGFVFDKSQEKVANE